MLRFMDSVVALVMCLPYRKYTKISDSQFLDAFTKSDQYTSWASGVEPRLQPLFGLGVRFRIVPDFEELFLQLIGRLQRS